MEEKVVQRVEDCDIVSLIPMEINPRFVKDDSFRKLQQSIQRDKDFMYLRPVLVNKTEKGMFIYAGTQRWRACKDLGWETIPCIVEENLSEEVVKERMLKDNIHAGKFDEIKLEEFDGSMLQALDIIDVGRNVAWVAPKNEAGDEVDPVVKNAGVKQGEFTFTIIFADETEKLRFDEVIKNISLKEGQRLEDFLLEKINEDYA